ncbi:MAG: gas vesicle protein GvpG [Nitrospiraceae bacterium]|nr:gas vesicle protein GvpG [Nitrospiraceae bacterium]
MLLVDDLLMLPLRGFIGIFKKIGEMAETESSDADRIREKLMEARLGFELDEISEEEYEKLETELLARLNSLRESRS